MMHHVCLENAVVCVSCVCHSLLHLHHICVGMYTASRSSNHRAVNKLLCVLQYYSLARAVKAHEDKCNKNLPEKYAKITMKHSEAVHNLSLIEQEYQAQVRPLMLMI